MPSETSRYAHLETLWHELPDGRRVAYLRKRVLPNPADIPALGRIALQRGERVDLLTARVMGDPTQFWRLLDANGLMRSEELAVSGDAPPPSIIVPMPWRGG